MTPVEKAKWMLRAHPGYVGTMTTATAVIDDMAKALTEISEQYENQDMTHADFRVMAKSLADQALGVHG